MPIGSTGAISLGSDGWELRLRRGDLLFRQGDPAIAWFSVLAGMVKTCRYHGDGQRQVTGFHVASDQIGIEREAYWATARVISEAAIVRRFARDSMAFPSGRIAGPDLFRAWHHAEQRALILGRRGALQRLATFLLLLEKRTSNQHRLLLPMTREDIADHLGMSSETVTRMLRSLERAGAILFAGPHRIEALDAVALAQIAGCDSDDTRPADTGRPGRAANGTTD